MRTISDFRLRVFATSHSKTQIIGVRIPLRILKSFMTMGPEEEQKDHIDSGEHCSPLTSCIFTTAVDQLDEESISI
jgi:hypothetical protein